MHPELKKLCKQTFLRYAYITRDDHNDYIWSTDVSKQHVTLTGTTAVILYTYITTGTVIVATTDDVTTYTLNVDYTIDYTTGELARTVGSTIPSGATVHVTYTYSTVTSYLARIENYDKLIRNAQGQEVLSTCQVYCDNDVVIDLRDKITSTEFAVTYPEILRIDRNPDETGALDHIVIYTK